MAVVLLLRFAGKIRFSCKKVELYWSGNLPNQTLFLSLTFVAKLDEVGPKPYYLIGQFKTQNSKFQLFLFHFENPFFILKVKRMRINL